MNKNTPYRCPKCGSTTFYLISHVKVYDKLHFNEDGTITILLEDASEITEGLDPLYCDEIECAECGEPIPTSIMQNIDQKAITIVS